MNVTKFDISLLFVMSLSIIIMSLTFPTLGLTGEDNETSASEVPEFNISSNRFDIAGDMPESPSTPQSGNLYYDEQDGGSIDGVTQKWIARDSSSDAETVIEIFNSTDPGMTLSYLRFDDTGAVVADDDYIYNESDVGTTIRHNNDSWVIDFDIDSLENVNKPNMTSEVSYKIRSSPGDSGAGLSSLPVIGGLFSAGEQLASMVGHAVSVIFWGIQTIFEIALNLMGILYDSMLFAVSLMQWLIGGYLAIITSAPGWAGVFMMAPAILLFAEFAKLAMVAISLLPTT